MRLDWYVAENPRCEELVYWCPLSGLSNGCVVARIIPLRGCGWGAVACTIDGNRLLGIGLKEHQAKDMAERLWRDLFPMP